MTEDDDSIDLLGDAEDGETPPAEEGGDRTDTDPATPRTGEPGDGESDVDPESHDRGNEPLGNLADRLDREDRAALDAREGIFEEVDTGEVDVEDVWEQLEAGPAPEGETVGEGDDVRRISRSVCHNCPHFGDPPDLHCTHEGTTIREMPDSEHFVVVECPVVAGEEDI